MPATMRTPSLEEVLRLAIENSLRGLHTATPGQIKSYDPSSQKADVQPVVQNVIRPDDGSDDIIESYPVIGNVPVIFPRVGGFFLAFTPQAGDTGLLIFGEKNIDVWLSGNGGEVNPVDTRHHDLSDAVFIPGLFSFGSPIQNPPPSGVRLAHDGGMTLDITTDDKLVLHIGAGNTVTFEQSLAGAKMTLGTGALSVAIGENLQILWGLLQLWSAAHTHLFPASGGAPTSVPVQAAGFPPFDPAILSKSTKVPV